MGNNSSTIKKINFENIIDFQKGIVQNCIMINTLPQNEQGCLISKTVALSDEEKIINNALYYNKATIIYIYGKNSHDMTIVSKAKQLVELGFTNVYVYVGGLFEWLLLQEIYGSENFKTNGEELDILKYRASKNDDFNEQLRLTM